MSDHPSSTPPATAPTADQWALWVERGTGGHLSDAEIADKVRMLMRGDLDHEAVCVMARDRIKYLSERLTLMEKQRDEVDRVLSLLVPGNFSEPRNQAVIRALEPSATAPRVSPMPDTSTPAEPSPERLKLMAGLIRSGSFIAREEREKIAAALSRLDQVERQRDASDAVMYFQTAKPEGRYAVARFCRDGETIYEAADRIQAEAIERHKRSLQQAGGY